MTVPSELRPLPRSERFAELELAPFDVLVVGGGINGAVTAAALAARGARVALIDRGDFAGQTSMHSSNLAWGGIKYLESYEFGLVRKLCLARNALMRAYPSAIREVRFLTTVPRGFRFPRWVVYLGAWLYWLIGGFFTQKPRLVSRAALAQEQPLVNVEKSGGGFEYSDAHIVDGDARFVLRFVLRAVEHGATVLNYVAARGSTRKDGLWHTEVLDVRPGNSVQLRATVQARVLINACGPFADGFNELCAIRTSHHHVLSKGVHLIVRRLTQGEGVLAFFATDGRLFFVIPLGNRSCIGTTDTRTSEPSPAVTEQDRTFILDNANALLQLPEPLTPKDIISERCGVRPLARAATANTPAAVEWTALSRKHVLEVNSQQAHVSIFGGKLTDCINVGEEIAREVAALGIALRPPLPWYGEGPAEERARFLKAADVAHVAEATALRLWRCHGTRGHALLRLIDQFPALLAPLFPDSDVLRAEAVYAGRYELVETTEDFLRRRTQLAQVLRPEAWSAGPWLEDTRGLLFGTAPLTTASSGAPSEFPGCDVTWR
jgi:glycerol-3-phosphate dehydrogenase